MKRWWHEFYVLNKAHLGQFTLAQITTHFNVFVAQSSSTGHKGRTKKHIVRKWLAASIDNDPEVEEKMRKLKEQE